MRTIRTRSIALGLALTIALILSNLVGLVALAEEAQTLTGGTASGVLAGDPDIGVFRQYMVAYPGDEVAVAFKLMPVYSDVTQAGAFGFNVYGPDGFDEAGFSVDATPAIMLTYVDSEAATLIVQVYNYGMGEVAYDLTVSGLPLGAPMAVEPQSAAAVTAAEESEALPPAQAIPTGDAETADETTTIADLPTSHTLFGSAAGAYDYVTVDSEGTGKDVDVLMTFAVIDPSFGPVVGFEVYAPSGGRVAIGHQQKPGTLRATFAAEVQGEYRVMVFNYAPGVPVTYTLDIAK